MHEFRKGGCSCFRQLKRWISENPKHTAKKTEAQKAFAKKAASEFESKTISFILLKLPEICGCSCVALVSWHMHINPDCWAKVELLV